MWVDEEMKMSDDSIIYCLENLAGYEPDDIDCDDVDISVNDDQFGSMSIVRTAALGAELARKLTEENRRLTELAAQKASRADELHEALVDVLHAESRNTGREPSLSVFHRAVGEALELIDKIKQESDDE